MSKSSDPVAPLERFRHSTTDLLDYAGIVAADNRAVVSGSVEGGVISWIHGNCYSTNEDVVVSESWDLGWLEASDACGFAEEGVVLHCQSRC